MIHYTFIVDQDTKFDFTVTEDSDTSVELEGDPVPQWARLEHLQCADCTLPAGSRKSCPAALAIKPVIEAFSNRISFQPVKVQVAMQDITMEASIPAQYAVRSLAGLLLALSSCPVLTKLRPMAHFHLPFGAKEHTAFRYLGTFLIAQYLRYGHGLPHSWDLDELLELFACLHRVNSRLAERICEATREDATVNSLIGLDTFVTSAELGIQKHLAKWEQLFAPYLTPPPVK